MKRVGRWAFALIARRLRGQSTVEVAAMFALLVPIVVGSVDLGRAYFGYDMLVHAVSEGARRGSLESDLNNISTNVKTTVHDASGPLNVPTTSVIVTCYIGSSTTTRLCPSMTVGDSVQVRADHVFTPITPLITAILPGGTLTLSATAQRTFQ